MSEIRINVCAISESYFEDINISTFGTTKNWYLCYVIVHSTSSAWPRKLMSSHLQNFYDTKREKEDRNFSCSNGDVHKQSRKWMFIVNNWKCLWCTSYNSCYLKWQCKDGGIFEKEQRRIPYKSDDILDYPI